MKNLLAKMMENVLDDINEFSTLNFERLKNYYGSEEAKKIMDDMIKTTKETGYVMGHFHIEGMYIKNKELRNDLSSYLCNAISETAEKQKILDVLEKAFKKTEAKEKIYVGKTMLRDALKLLSFLDDGDNIGIEIIEDAAGFKLLRLKTKDVNFIIAPIKDDFLSKEVASDA